jgi:catechol 2,3-dioxygenase-like lactoylglutathione lyase family enzyme
MKQMLRVGALTAAALAACAMVAFADDPPPEVMGTKDNTWQTFFLSKAERDRPHANTATPIAAGDIVAPMARATVFSRDRSRALYLYQNVLGLNTLTDTYWRGLAINRVKGTTGLEQHAVIMMAGDSGEGNIGVYQLYRESLAPPAIRTDAKLHTGDYALTFYTNNIEKVFEGAKDIGFTIIMPPTAQANGEERLIFRGPDGVIEHFVQAK